MSEHESGEATPRGGGDPCPDGECGGSLSWSPDGDCSCHMSPPCLACVPGILHCGECWEEFVPGEPYLAPVDAAEPTP